MLFVTFINRKHFMILAPIRRFLERRRFPTLLLIGTGLLLLNIIIPDALPFVDEILMLIATLLIGSLSKNKQEQAEAGSSGNTNSG